jgi:S1-C subfamily serine protease
MKLASIIWVALIFGGQPAIAQVESPAVPKAPGVIEHGGAPLDANSTSTLAAPSEPSLQSSDHLPSKQLSEIANHTFKEEVGDTRSAKDAALYRSISPSVVKIVTKDSLGSGSLISSDGFILTNWHVVEGATDVYVVFKPTTEGAEPTKDEIRLGRVVKLNPIADLALVKVAEVPTGRRAIRIGDGSDISIGIDAHAIGHPNGEAWTYTKGVISQYRIGFEWTIGTERHKADVVQTQTPINPGDSGGPLLDDNGTLIGVNTMTTTGAQGLNFAVSADEAKRFIGRPNQAGERPEVAKQTCETKETARFRNIENNARVISYDTRCTGKADAVYTVPDNKAEAVTLTKDRNGDGRVDLMYFDFKHQGKWDLSFWDETFGGHWTLVGFHPDGKITPTQYEGYETYQRRVASR